MYFDTKLKHECTGCGSCSQICPKKAIVMQMDGEGFSYPKINSELCIQCNLCRKTCPIEHPIEKHSDNKYVFGGYHLNADIKSQSTSGGAFSAIVDSFCDENYVIFGAEADGLRVFHGYIINKSELAKFRKSKYSQSEIGLSYIKAKDFLKDGKKVLFSGTPCQIAGLISCLGNINKENLLTVEVVCEGVPSPLYIRKYEESLEKKYSAKIEKLDYRFKGKNKWDFEMMETVLSNGKIIKRDRWFNPFWNVWLKHLMSRPSCYCCQFAEQGRVADITLGDLWGVHLYCPELYGRNGGASLIVANTEKGIVYAKKAECNMHGHELDFHEALKYQSPMRKHIDKNSKRDEFICDLQSSLSFEEINNKWYDKPTLKLLFQKYIWGNRQKVWFWNLKHSCSRGRKND